MKHIRMGFFLFLLIGMSVVSCNKTKKKSDENLKPRYLYVATGACYSGNGITTFTNLTASNLIYRINLETGVREDVIADYYSAPSIAGDSPVSLVDYDEDHLLVLVENTSSVASRRIEIIEKKPGGSRSLYSNNSAALSAQLRRMRKLSDDYLLISKSTSLEKHKDGTNRLLNGVNPWVSLSAPASSCTASASILTSMAQLPTGLLVFSHAGSGQSRIGVVSALGYGVAGDCKAAQAAPIATSYPTSMFYDYSHQKLVVSYGGNSTVMDMNSIYSYSVNETTGAISSPQKIYDSNLFGSTYNYLLFGISALAYDEIEGNLYIASTISTAAAATNFKIEKFRYDASGIGVTNSSVLIHAGSTFYPYGSDTKCISDLLIAH